MPACLFAETLGVSVSPWDAGLQEFFGFCFVFFNSILLRYIEYNAQILVCWMSSYIGKTAVEPPFRSNSRAFPAPRLPALPAIPSQGHCSTLRFAGVSLLQVPFSCSAPFHCMNTAICFSFLLLAVSSLSCLQFGAMANKAVINTCICFHLSWVVFQSCIILHSNLQEVRVSLVPYPDRWWNCPWYPWCWRELKRIFLPCPPFCSSCVLCPLPSITFWSIREYSGDGECAEGSWGLSLWEHLKEVGLCKFWCI